MKEFKYDLRILLYKVFAEIDNNKDKYKEFFVKDSIYAPEFVMKKKHELHQMNFDVVNSYLPLEAEKLLNKHRKEYVPKYSKIETVEYQLYLSNVLKMAELDGVNIPRSVFKQIIDNRDDDTISVLNQAYKLNLVEPSRSFNNKCTDVLKSIQNMCIESELNENVMMNRDMIFATVNSTKEVL